MRRLVLPVLAGLLLVLALPARAHSYADPALRTVFDAVQPALPAAVQVSVVPSVVDQLVVSNPTSTPLDVIAVGGEPFLRISSVGVLANLASPDWYSTGTPEGGPVPPQDVVRDKGKGAPRWELVSHDHVWTEFDPRLHPVAAVTPAMRLAGKEQVLAVWRIPLAYGAQRVAATGHVLFSPIRGGLTVAVTDAPAGITATAVQGELPGLFFQAPAGRRVTVSGSDGRPYLRFQDGTVQANTASPSWAADQRAKGREVTAAGWVAVSHGLTYSWLDPRLRYPADQPPEAEIGRTTVVKRWTVPLTVDSAPAQLAGTVTWVPRAVGLRQVGVRSDGSGWTWWPYPLGAVVVGTAIWWLRRRERRVAG